MSGEQGVLNLFISPAVVAGVCAAGSAVVVDDGRFEWMRWCGLCAVDTPVSAVSPVSPYQESIMPAVIDEDWLLEDSLANKGLSLLTLSSAT
ncbi:Leucine-Rich Repeat Protein 1 [Manis pentadactyla]|nr:Leucine-Rich Repeat Protein 1 [Manis pentadactyla]